MANPIELRVHGVSGTPPRNMLYTDPRPVGALGNPCGDPSPDYVQVFQRSIEPADADVDIRAFHWGGVTSKSLWSVFWILLTPFMLANVAGWVSSQVSRGQAAAVRVAGLGLTALFVAQAVTVGVAIPVLWIEQRPGLSIEVPAAATLACLVALNFFILVLLATRSPFERGFSEQLTAGLQQLLTRADDVDGDAPVVELDPGVTNDPAGDLGLRTVTSGRFIEEPALVVGRLRRSHLGFGWAVIALVVAKVGGVSDWTVGVAYICAAVLVVWVVVSTLWPDEPGFARVPGLEAFVGLVPFFLVIVSLARGDGSAMDAVEVHQAVFWISVGAVSAAIVAGLLSGWRSMGTMGAFVLSTLFGAALGISLAMGMEQLLKIKETQRMAGYGAGWVAVAALFLLMSLLAWVCLIQIRAVEDVADDRSVATAIRRVMLRGDHVLRMATVAFVAIIATGVVALIANGWRPENLEDPEQWRRGFITFGLVLAAALFVTVPTLRKPVGLGVIFGVLALSGIRALWQVLELGWVPSTSLVQVATILAVLVPGGLMVLSILRGLRQGSEARRKVGVLWDVGSFWPRWYHPLAPPPYGPFVIRKLALTIRTMEPAVVSGHSQGSMVALVTLCQLPAHERLPFISYGSQIGGLYRRVFPQVGLDAAIESLEAGEWKNLWRDFDPIGGHQVAALGPAGNVHEDSDRKLGHSCYEPTDAFRGVRDGVLPGG